MLMAGARVRRFNCVIIRRLLIKQSARYCTNNRFDSMRTHDYASLAGYRGSVHGLQ